MRWFALAFGIICGTVIVYAAARFGFKTSDNDADGLMAAFMYGAITVGGLGFHALGVHVCRKHRAIGGLIVAVSFLALAVSLSNSLGALAGRGNETQALRLQTAETVRNLRRSLSRSETEREGLRFTPTSAEAVRAAKSKADAATATKEAECKKRGDKCRDREADEARALEALQTASNAKSVTDRAVALDAEISELKGKLERAGPVLDANPQGSAFARLVNLPEDEASLLTTWQNLAMAVILEILVVSSFVAFEVLGHGAEAKPASERARRPQEAASGIEVLSPVEEPKAFPSPQKPRLIASRPDPLGNVALIMADVMEPGKGKVEIEDAFKAYAAECSRISKKPVPVPVFVDALKLFCTKLAIETKQDKRGHVHLIGVRIKKSEKKDVATLD